MTKEKNLWILPTDKPSRLYVDSQNNICITDVEMKSGNKQHLYITNSEEIKEGDWVLNIEENTIFKPSNDEIYDIKNSEAKYYEYCKKIILTTDQDLIKDGLQAIDDEFLELFVKNPSCESVEVEKDVFFESVNYHFYKNIILKEKAKIILKEKAKQETVQEVAERLYPIKIESCMEGKIDVNSYERNLFIKGAKWQAERMYSEEDLKEVYKVNYTPFSANNFGDFDKDWNKWFEQFKKK